MRDGLGPGSATDRLRALAGSWRGSEKRNRPFGRLPDQLKGRIGVGEARLMLDVILHISFPLPSKIKFHIVHSPKRSPHGM